MRILDTNDGHAHVRGGDAELVIGDIRERAVVDRCLDGVTAGHALRTGRPVPPRA